MPWTKRVIGGNGGSITVGTTGRIGTLMRQELECIKHSSRGPSHSGRKHQTEPVPAHCCAVIPRKALKYWTKTPSKFGSSNNGLTRRRAKPLHIPQGHGHHPPMLSLMDRNLNSDKMEKEEDSHVTEVVDLKCVNLLSSRLNKLGFSKLSHASPQQATLRRFSGFG